MSARVLEVRSASKRYGQISALAGLDVELRAGEWVALLGPNGAGKTTLMRAIAGQVELDTGRIAIRGAPAGSSEARGRLGIIPQRVALYRDLTVRENLQLFGRLHGVPRAAIASQLRWALDWTGLGERADSPARQLSGGMQRRLNIGCGVLHAPSLLLLDEPTVGVDGESRQRICDMLEKLRADGVTLLQSTHAIAELESSCDRVLIMQSGRILADGPVRELIAAGCGMAHLCRVTLDRAPNGLDLGARFEARGSVLTGSVHDVAVELSPLLERIRGSGLRVREVRIDPPRLEDLFAQLTLPES